MVPVVPVGVPVVPVGVPVVPVGVPVVPVGVPVVPVGVPVVPVVPVAVVPLDEEGDAGAAAKNSSRWTFRPTHPRMRPSRRARSL